MIIKKKVTVDLVIDITEEDIKDLIREKVKREDPAIEVHSITFVMRKNPKELSVEVDATIPDSEVVNTQEEEPAKEEKPVEPKKEKLALKKEKVEPKKEEVAEEESTQPDDEIHKEASIFDDKEAAKTRKTVKSLFN